MGLSQGRPLLNIHCFCSSMMYFNNNYLKNIWVTLSDWAKVAQSCLTLCNPMDYSALGILQGRIWQNTFPSPGNLPNPGINPGLPHCRQILSSWATREAFSSVAQSCPTLCDPMNRSTPGFPIHHQLPEFTQNHVHQLGDAIQPSHFSVVPFSSCPQSLPASGSFPMSQLFAWGGQSTGISASTSVLPVNTQDSSPLGWTGWLSLQSKGLSRVFSNTTVQKHQFFGAQLSSQTNSHIHTWPLEKQ